MNETDQKREDEVLRRMLKTPPKPHKITSSKEGGNDGNRNRDHRSDKR